MAEQVKVSVVIPAYNSEKTICRCLDSVAGQTLRDIEIICVDDGSTDRTLELMREYAEKDPRVRVLTQRNRYAGVARNYGMSVAKGEYLAFLDSDDYYLPNGLEQLYEIASAQNIDMVKCSAYMFEAGGEPTTNDYYQNSSVTPKKRNKPIYFNDAPQMLLWVADVPWNGLYKRSFLEEHGIQFNDQRCVNDHSFCIWCLVSNPKMLVSDVFLTCYRVNQSGSLIGTRGKYFSCQIGSYQIVKEIVSKLEDRKMRQRVLRRELDSLFLWYGRIIEDRGPNEEIERQMEQFARTVDVEDVGEKFLKRTQYNRTLARMKAARDVPVYNHPARMYEEGAADPKVSVIIPVYNVADYIRPCIDSILAQSFQDLEIICINDGSSDDSLSILEEYAARDPRFTVISQRNSGPSKARNQGFAVCRGEYIYCIDSDDLLAPEALEELMAHSEAERLDLLYFGAESLFESEEMKKKHGNFQNHYLRKKTDGTVSGDEMMEIFLRDNNFLVSTPLTLIRREFLEESGVLFLEGIVHEDELFAALLLSRAERVAVTDRNYYLRRIRPSSIMTNKKTARNYEGYAVAFMELWEEAKRREGDPSAYRFLLSRAKLMDENARYVLSDLPDAERRVLYRGAPAPYRSLYRLSGSLAEDAPQTALVTPEEVHGVKRIFDWVGRKWRGAVRMTQQYGLPYTLNMIKKVLLSAPRKIAKKLKH